jgi:hypothetical protein
MKKEVSVKAKLIIGIIALVLLPDSLGGMLSKDIQVIIYFVSFISWIAGLNLQMIKTKYKTSEE